MTSALEETKRLMGSLVRMRPKPHEKMKVGKRKTETRAKKRGASKTKNA